jgi:hypothetical protein
MFRDYNSESEHLGKNYSVTSYPMIANIKLTADCGNYYTVQWTNGPDPAKVSKGLKKRLRFDF